MIIRLHPDQTIHWALFGVFQRRCLDCGERNGWPIQPMLLREIQHRFVAMPWTAGFFLAKDSRAHLLSWTVSVWGEMGIQVYQAEGDPGYLQPLLEEFFDICLPKWIDEVQQVTRTTGNEQRISFLEYTTERPAGWERLLRPYGVRVIAEKQMTLVRLAPRREQA